MLLDEKKDKSTENVTEAKVSAIAAMDIEGVVKQLTEAATMGSILESNFNFFVGQKDALKRFISDFNTMETAVTSLALKFGGARGMADEIKKSIDLATPSVVALGGTIDDVVNIQKGVISALQTQTILDKEAYKDLYAIGNLINDGTKTSAESTKTLVSQFVNAGYSLYDISKQMGDIVNMAREIGVATAAVYKQLSENMSKLNLYNFEGGVQGMGKMAAEAASLRLNMSDTLGFAEKVFKPEDAIQMAADMQRLGVQVSSLLDPYKLMDMSRNHPEELQKSLYEAAAAMTMIDDKGRTIINPAELGRVREMADVMKMSAEQVAQMGINYADMQRKMEVIKFSSVVPEEDRKFVAGLAQYKDGKYVVNVGLDSKGEQVLKEVSKLGKEELDKIKEMEGDKTKSPAELQVEANNALSVIAANTASLKGVLPRQMAASSNVNKFMKKAGDMAMPVVESAESAFGVKRKKGGYIDVEPFQGKMNKLGDGIFDSVMSVIQDPSEKGLKSAFRNFSDAFSKEGTILMNDLSKVFSNATEISKKGKQEGRFKESFDYGGIEDGLTKIVGFFNQIITGKESSSSASNLLGVTNSTSSTNNVNTTNNTNTNTTIPTNNVNTTNTTNTNNTTPTITTPTNTTTTTPSLFDIMYNALNDVFKRFENPGTLKVTLINDKAGLINAVSSGAEMTSTAMGQNINDLKTSMVKTGTKTEKSEVVKVEIPKTVDTAEKPKIEIVIPKSKEVTPTESKETTNKTLTSTITVPSTTYTTPDILKGAIPKISTESTETKTLTDIIVNFNKLTESTIDFLNKNKPIRTAGVKEPLVSQMFGVSEISKNLKSMLSDKVTIPTENKIVEKTIETKPLTDVFVNEGKLSDSIMKLLLNTKPETNVGVKESPLFDLTTIGKELKPLSSEKTTPEVNMVKKSEEPKPTTDIFVNEGKLSDSIINLLLNTKQQTNTGIKESPTSPLFDLSKISDNLKSLSSEKTTTPIENRIVEKTIETKTPTDIFVNEGKLSDSIMNLLLNTKTEKTVGSNKSLTSSAFDLTNLSKDLKTLFSEKMVTPEVKIIEKQGEPKPTTDIFVNEGKLTESIMKSLLNTKQQTTVGIKESLTSPAFDLTNFRNELKSLSSEKTGIPTPEIKKVEKSEEPKPIIDVFVNEDKISKSIMNLLLNTKPETNVGIKESLIPPTFDLSKISDNLMDFLQKNKVEKVEKIETKEKETPFNIDVKLPDYLKNIVSEKKSEKTNVMTTVSLTEKMSELTKEFFNKENKEKTNILSPNINDELMKMITGKLKPEEYGRVREIKNVIEPLSSNIKLDDFTKEISNITNIENKEVKPPAAVELKMTNEIKDLLSNNKTNTFIEKLTTTPSIFTPTVDLPKSLMNYKPDELKPTTFNKELFSTNTKTTEIFNDVSKISNPNSLITKLNDTNKGLYGSITNYTPPVKEQNIVNVKEPTTVTPITSVIPPTTTATIPNVNRTETERMTKETNRKQDVGINGTIKIEVPNNMHNMAHALNDPGFIKNLQERILEYGRVDGILKGNPIS
jgi:hypothetical protein